MDNHSALYDGYDWLPQPELKPATWRHSLATVAIVLLTAGLAAGLALPGA